MDGAEIAAQKAVADSVAALVEVLRLRSMNDSEIAEVIEDALVKAGLKNFEVIC